MPKPKFYRNPGSVAGYTSVYMAKYAKTRRESETIVAGAWEDSEVAWSESELKKELDAFVADAYASYDEEAEEEEEDDEEEAGKGEDEGGGGGGGRRV